jgi:hypothetical protein
MPPTRTLKRHAEATGDRPKNVLDLIDRKEWRGRDDDAWDDAARAAVGQYLGQAR